MIDSSMYLEKVLQTFRFRKAKPYLVGDVLDFGGNKGELQQFVKGKYLLVNYDYSEIHHTQFDTIVALAVIEHIEYDKVFHIFHTFKKILKADGHIFLTTPSAKSRPILELAAFLGLLDKENISEHKHYWDQKDIFKLASETGFAVAKYSRFQLGLNQYALLRHI